MKFALFIVLQLFTLNARAIDCQDEHPIKSFHPSYATFFSIDYFKGFKRLRVDNDYYYVGPKEISKCGFKSFVIYTPIQKVAMYSTTYLPALELLKLEDHLVAFENPKYIVSGNFKTDKIKKLGSQFNLELLKAQRFDFIMGNAGQFGNSIKKSLMIQLKIPFINNKDFEEKTPLARAEWIIFIASLFDGEEEAVNLFKQIEKSYLEIKEKNLKFKVQPKVLVGSIEQGFWTTCGGRSDLAQMIQDAGGQLVLSRPSTSTQHESLEVVRNFKAVDLWLPLNTWESREDLFKAMTRESRYKMVQYKKVFNNTKQLNRWKFNSYWQNGMQRPDLMLADLSAMIHPDAYPNHSLQWYREL